MTYPIIILGAGASSDYIHQNVNKKSIIKPPLTDNLFQHYLSTELLSRNKEADILASNIVSTMRGQKKTLEQCLNEERDVAFKNPNKLRQIIGLQFYLQDLFKKISNEYSQPLNNYNTLLDIIDNTESKKACFVNFNYDLLLERELPYFKHIKTIDAFIKNDIKIIKIHGAYNWGYVLKRFSAERCVEEKKDARNFILNNLGEIEPSINKNIYLLDQDEKGQIRVRDYYLERQDTSSNQREGFFFAPAITIPIFNKNYMFCPSTHIDALKEALQETDRILIIGWSAGDPEFIDIIKNEFSKRQGGVVKITIVSKNEKSAEEIMLKLNQEIKGVSIIPGKQNGFSEFIDSGECEKFFRDPNF